jgi:hypothetical protein
MVLLAFITIGEDVELNDAASASSLMGRRGQCRYLSYSKGQSLVYFWNGIRFVTSVVTSITCVKDVVDCCGSER